MLKCKHEKQLSELLKYFFLFTFIKICRIKKLERLKYRDLTKQLKLINPN